MAKYNFVRSTDILDDFVVWTADYIFKEPSAIGIRGLGEVINGRGNAGEETDGVNTRVLLILLQRFLDSSENYEDPFHLS